MTPRVFLELPKSPREASTGYAVPAHCQPALPRRARNDPPAAGTAWRVSRSGKIIRAACAALLARYGIACDALTAFRNPLGSSPQEKPDALASFFLAAHLRQLAAWQGSGRGLTPCLNLGAWTMTDREYLRKLVAELDAKAGDVLTVLEAVEDDDDDQADELRDALDGLQLIITTWQEAKGYV